MPVLAILMFVVTAFGAGWTSKSGEAAYLAPLGLSLALSIFKVVGLPKGFSIYEYLW